MSIGDRTGIEGRGRGIGRSMSAGVLSAGAEELPSFFDEDGEGSGAPAIIFVSKGDTIGMEGNGTGRLIKAGDVSLGAGTSPVGDAALPLAVDPPSFVDPPSLAFGVVAAGGGGGDAEGAGFPATIFVITGERTGMSGNDTGKSISAGFLSSRCREC